MLSCRVEHGNDQSISALLSDNRGAKARLGAFSSHHAPKLAPNLHARRNRFQKQCLDMVRVLLTNSAIPYRSS